MGIKLMSLLILQFELNLILIVLTHMMGEGETWRGLSSIMGNFLHFTGEGKNRNHLSNLVIII